MEALRGAGLTGVAAWEMRCVSSLMAPSSRNCHQAIIRQSSGNHQPLELLDGPLEGELPTTNDGARWARGHVDVLDMDM
eukprot:1929623-Prymnesium_polylepis.1